MLWQIAVCVAIMLIIRALFSSSHPHLDKLPGPRRWPIVGSLPMFLGLSESELFTLTTNFPKIFNGHRIVLKLFNVYTIHLYNPKDIEIVLSNSKNISKNTPYAFMEPWLGTGLLISTGGQWHKRRKILTPAFHFEILKNFARVFEEQSRNMVVDLQSRLQRGADVVDVMPLFTDYMLYIICETAMGIRFNSGITKARSVYTESIQGIGEGIIKRHARFWLYPDFSFYLSPTGKQFTKQLEQNSLFTHSVIDERRKTRQHDEKEIEGNEKRRLALLDLLLDAESKGEIDVAGIIDEVNTFMFAGHDTTALAVTFGLVLLADHEDVQECIYEECKRIFGESSRTANTSDLVEMKYLEAVIKEILRIYPSVPFIGRHVTEDFMLGDLRIPRGADVIIHIYELHRRPDLFPEPEAFRPERFLSGDKMNFSYVPFSAGSRNCIGQRFAMQEMKYMLSEIVRHFRLTPIEKGYRPKIKSDLVLRPNEPVLVKFSAR